MKKETPSRNILKLELAAEILREFAEVRFVARGNSMLPAIYPGDCLTVSSFGDGEPRCGDVVLCRIADGFRVHRIVKILGEGAERLYVLRGDALVDEDAPVSGDELLGRVTSIVRRGMPLRLRTTMGMRGRVVGLIVRHSTVAVALLLGWQRMQARYFQRGEGLMAGAGETKTEYT